MKRDFRRLHVVHLLMLVGIPVGCSQPSESRSEPDPADAQDASDVTVVPVGDLWDAHLAQDQRPSNSQTQAETQRAQAAFRSPQPDPQLNRQRLAAAGIHMLQSERLILLTDRDPESVRDLPVLADALFEVLQQQCGTLLPAESGARFQAIGCLMVDETRFQSVGLMPDAVAEMRHGQQQGYRFWARDQPEEYYRRHLVLHEFVHVYTTIDSRGDDLPGRWFQESAAEYFATHRLTPDKPEFGVVPATFTGFEGWGRISAIRRRRVDRPDADGDQQPLPGLQAVLSAEAGQGSQDDNYPWWWALGWMLSRHPDYRMHWEQLCHTRRKADFQSAQQDLLSAAPQRLAVDWLLFTESVSEMFDDRRSFAVHRDSKESRPAEVTIRADRGWQDSGWVIEPGDTLQLRSSGRCVLNQTTVEWVSEANGITLEYNQGRPLGELVAVVVDGSSDWLSRRIPVGIQRDWTAPRGGRLWLQINDDAGNRDNNSGQYTVGIQGLESVSPE